MFISSGSHLNNQFQSELHLTRRAGLPCWEARVGDTAKRRAADDVARPAEVRVVKEVEELGPELRSHPLAKPGVLDDRKISVIEPRPDDHVASQAAEARDRPKYRGLEPAVYAADDLDRPGYVRTERVGDAVDDAIAGNDIERVAALSLDYRGKFPALDKPAAAER